MAEDRKCEDCRGIGEYPEAPQMGKCSTCKGTGKVQWRPEHLVVVDDDQSKNPIPGETDNMVKNGENGKGRKL